MLWRIYSPNKTGILISTTVKRFELLQGVRELYLGRVIYFEDVPDLLEKAKQCKEPYGNACLKRSAFRHEEEVRLLTHGDFIDDYKPGQRYVSLKLDPLQFVESVTVDPRAADWFVDTVKGYCRRAGFSVEPVKSALYALNPHLTLGIVTKYTTIK